MIPSNAVTGLYDTTYVHVAKQERQLTQVPPTRSDMPTRGLSDLRITPQSWRQILAIRKCLNHSQQPCAHECGYQGLENGG